MTMHELTEALNAVRDVGGSILNADESQSELFTQSERTEVAILKAMERIANESAPVKQPSETP